MGATVGRQTRGTTEARAGVQARPVERGSRDSESRGHHRGVLPQPPPLPSARSTRCPGEQGTELPVSAHLMQPLAPWDISPEAPRAGPDEEAAAQLEAAAPRDRARSLCRGRRTPQALGKTPRRGWGGSVAGLRSCFPDRDSPLRGRET